VRLMLTAVIRGESCEMEWRNGLLLVPKEIDERLRRNGFDVSTPVSASKAIITLERVLGQELGIRHLHDAVANGTADVGSTRGATLGESEW